MSDSLQLHESQHARLPCPSPTPGVYSNPCPSSRWCHPAISSSVVPFSSYPNPSQHQGLFPWVNSSHHRSSQFCIFLSLSLCLSISLCLCVCLCLCLCLSLVPALTPRLIVHFTGSCIPPLPSPPAAFLPFSVQENLLPGQTRMSVFCGRGSIVGGAQKGDVEAGFLEGDVAGPAALTLAVTSTRWYLWGIKHSPPRSTGKTSAWWNDQRNI